MTRIVLDDARCDMHGECVVLAPEIFEITDDDAVVVLLDVIPDTLRTRAQEAVDGCPVQALRLEDGR